MLRYFNLTGRAERDHVFRHLLSGKFGGFAHALCWDASGAENWGGRLDDVPAQSFADDVIAHVLADAVRAAQVPGAIVVDGKPLFAVAHADRLPDAAAFASAARAAFAAAGLGGVHLAALECVQGSKLSKASPDAFGFDSLIQNPLTGIESLSTRGIKASGARIVDYKAVAQHAVPLPGAPVLRFPAVSAGFDETALARPGARTLGDVSPSALQAWLRTVLDQVDLGTSCNERLVFLASWNDWTRCAYVEPDQPHGHAFLSAIRDARMDGSMRRPAGLRPHAEPSSHDAPAIFIHAYYLDVFDEILQRIVDEGIHCPLYVTTPETQEKDAARILADKGLEAQVMPCSNRGRDVLPFLTHLHRIQQDGHSYVLKLHTKKSPHREDGAAWRNELFAQFLNRRNLEQVVSAFDRQPDLGIAGPEMHILPIDDHLVENAAHLGKLTARLGQSFENALTRDSFVAGTMFFARFSALVPILKLGLGAEDFEQEAGQVDGTLAHALERAFGISARINNRRVASFESILLSRSNRRAAKRSFHS
jgi:hypothetical protein